MEQRGEKTDKREQQEAGVNERWGKEVRMNETIREMVKREELANCRMGERKG